MANFIAGSVGQTFLSARRDVRRQECLRHSGAAPAMAYNLGVLGALAVHTLRRDGDGSPYLSFAQIGVNWRSLADTLFRVLTSVVVPCVSAPLR